MTDHDQSPAAPAPRLSITGASKTFGRVKVLDDVSLEVHAGEIHGLVGQNGSGKSTLIKMLSGLYSSDPGTEIRLDGVLLKMPIHPSELLERGLAFVHQDLGLDLDANVIENVRIGRYTINRLTRSIRWRSEADSVARALHRIGADTVSPYALVRKLNHAERASVAIARAIQGIELGEGLIVFDESTQSLPRNILHEFYAQVRAIAASGTGVLIVSHRLDEVLALCDTVTVLEDGRATVRDSSTASMSEADLTALLLGKSASGRSGMHTVKSVTSERGDVVLEAIGVAGSTLTDASLTVHAGEVVGVIGTSDSGYDELPYLLAGVRQGTGGIVRVGGTEIRIQTATPREVIAAGLTLVPGDRGGQGIARELPALDNLTLPRMTQKGSPFGIGLRWQLAEFRQAVLSLGITPPRPDYVAGAFSGGNQQKLLLGKWLLNSPRVLVLHEPTQAVDVGAREDILRELRRQAAAGVAVLVSSLEASDLANVCDRVLVIKDGRVDRELSGEQLEPHTIIDAVYTDVSTEIRHVGA